MKYLIIAALLCAVVGFIYWRLRPYVRMARRALEVVRGFGQLGDLDAAARGQAVNATPRPGAKAVNEKLVRCSACGTWTPATRALSLRNSPNVYCSTACLERAADTPRRADKSA